MLHKSPAQEAGQKRRLTLPFNIHPRFTCLQDVLLQITRDNILLASDVVKRFE